MAVNPCPHCGHAAMSTLRKFQLLAKRSIACENCGQPLKVSNRGRSFGILTILVFIIVREIVFVPKAYQFATLGLIAAAVLAIHASDRVSPLLRR